MRKLNVIENSKKFIFKNRLINQEKVDDTKDVYKSYENSK